MRIFTALLLPEEFRGKLYNSREALRNSSPRLHWIKQENYHITLQFLGELTPREAEGAAYLLEETSSYFNPFELGTAGPAQLPGSGIPRVIFEEIKEGKRECKKISRHYSQRLKQEEYQIEERKYHPHITLCRVKRNYDFQDSPRDDSLLSPLHCKIQSLGVFRSHLSPKGSHYDLLAEFPLKQKAAITAEIL